MSHAMVLTEGATVATVATGDQPTPPSRWTRRQVLLIALPLLIPLLGVLIVMHQEHWYPTGDLAQAELHLRGFPRHPPLVGAAGRIGNISIPYGQGSHPGPSLWIALLPVYLLFGRTSFGVMAAMVSLHTAAIIGSILVARRLGGNTLAAIIAVACAFIVRAGGSEFLVEPWNPWGAVLPYMLFLLLITAIVRGDRKLLPVAILVGTHCVQCHVGYLPIVAVPLAGAIGWRLRIDRGKLLRPLLWSAGLFVLLWIPPVVDELRRHPGNFTILWHHFTKPDAPTVGLVAAFKAFMGEFSVTGGWLIGPKHLPTQPPNVFGFLGMVALVAAATVVAVRRRDREVLTFLGVIGFGCVVGIFTIARIFGEFYDYVIRWLWILTVLAVAASAWSFIRAVKGWDGPARARLERWVAIGATAAVAIVSIVSIGAMANDTVPAVRNSRLVGGVAPKVATELDHHGRYLVRWHDPASLGAVGFGVALELERRGVTVGVDAWASAGALPSRVMPENTATGVLWVVAGDKAIDDFRHRADAKELAFYDERTPAERVRSAQLLADIHRRLTEIGRADLIPSLDTQYGLANFVIGTAPVPQDIRVLVADYIDLRLPIGVFEVPPGSPLYP